MRKTLLTLAAALAFFAANASGLENMEMQANVKEETKTSKPIELDKEGFIKNVSDLKEWKYVCNKPAIVDFYATWCGPCKMIAPILDELAAEYADEIVIFKIDIDKEKELTSHFGIKSIPTLFFIPMEGEPHILQGAMSKDDFKKLIDSVLLDKE